ncbi:D-alanyl-D-alanine carboxypeptidase [Pseudomethylobacillus aquaticus]|uniref:serine-type D-Ala-D-Ala carboxypeptidase n=1 Tax=Pseudomethylobacillus aquaticus TaxID=2676064 RepID=A0A3N0UUE6_9PROT|nr:D-alanyl-D-alanine carboxypeptidase family protein [Pseudomethylobacillus aquaticus]ROH84063.1 D-alanyl-D-alanine carboxypeptidase [Pseudomethylobacillus aquaticus]
MPLFKALTATALLLIAMSSLAAPIPPQPTLAVKSYVLRDFNSDSVLAQQAGDERVEPASLTKIMTAYMVFKALKNGHLQLTQTLPVSVKAWKVEGSKMFIEPNKPVTVDELLHGTIIQSGNDSSIALAEGIGGTEEVFAELMNKEAARLGMKNSHFMNATGLPDPQHYTTATDLAILAAALIRDFPDDYKRLYSVKEYTYNKITQPNRNTLLWQDPYVDGMKTGHTKSAGYCLITSAKRGDTRMISVVLGAGSSTSRATESQKLLNYGFQFYESTLVYKRGQKVNNLRVWKGAEPSIDATLARDLSVTLPKGDYARVKASITSTQPLVAPISANQAIGKITLTLDDKVLVERNLIASKAVPAAGIFGRLVDSVKLWFE